jgi:hypothetical protein
MPEKKSLDWFTGFKTPPGSDTVLEVMKQEGIPLTRENYLAMAYPTPEDVPEWSAELEAELPRELREILEQTTQSD